jgi:hypothetical protein
MLVDYVRVYQAANTSERFQAAFVDDAVGWREIHLPFTDFTASQEQPQGAPADGFDLREIWGFRFLLPAASQGTFYLDDMRFE